MSMADIELDGWPDPARVVMSMMSRRKRCATAWRLAGSSPRKGVASATVGDPPVGGSIPRPSSRTAPEAPENDLGDLGGGQCVGVNGDRRRGTGVGKSGLLDGEHCWADDAPPTLRDGLR